MATTPNLGLPLIDGAMTADVPRDMNALANAVDTAVEEALADVSIPDASLTVKGKTQLSSATGSVLEDRAATPKAVNDARVAAISAASTDATTKANTAETNAKNYVDAKAWQKYKITNDNGTTLNISNQNINNVLISGFYAGENITNAPTTAVGAWWYIEVISMSGTHIKQIAMDLFNNTYQQRTNNGSGWSAWTPDVFQSGVDAKNGIVGAINAKGGSASTSDTWAQLAAKISAIQTGPKYATGSASAGGNMAFNITGGGGISASPLTVTGLGFRPNKIIVKLPSDPTYLYVYDFYTRSAAPSAGGSGYNYYSYFSGATHYTIIVSEYTGSGSGASNAFVNDTSFRVPVSLVGTYTWEAFGV